MIDAVNPRMSELEAAKEILSELEVVGHIEKFGLVVVRVRGQYIMIITPIMATKPPIKSNLSGTILSICQPHRIDSTMKIPPYAA